MLGMLGWNVRQLLRLQMRDPRMSRDGQTSLIDCSPLAIAQII